MNKQPGILIVLRAFEENQPGAEKAQYYIARFLIQQGWRVTIYCRVIPTGEVSRLKNLKNVRVIIRPRLYLLLLPWYLLTSDVEYVLSWRWEYNLIGSLSCWLRHIRNTVFVHGFLFKEYVLRRRSPALFPLYRWISRYTLNRLVDLIFVPSHDLKTYLGEELGASHIEVQYNGVPDRRPVVSRRECAGMKQVLFLGGYQSHKGIFKLLDLAEHNPGYTFHIYGSVQTDEAEEVKRIMRTKPLTNIVVHGFSDNIAAVMEKFCLLVYPSELDNFPFAVVEAMRAGMVIVASDVGELKHILRDGENSIVVQQWFGLNLGTLLDEYDLPHLMKNSRQDYLNNYTIGVYAQLADRLLGMR